MADTPASALFDVFLSYSHEDTARVVEVEAALVRRGISIWRDRGQILAGDSWVQRIEEGLPAARCVLLFLSSSARGSKWVQKEWRTALAVEKRIIPIRLDNSNPPVLLTELQFLDLSDAAALDACLDAMVAGINGVPGASSNEARSKPSRIEAAAIQRMIGDNHRAIRNARIVRIISPVAGIAASGTTLLFGLLEGVGGQFAVVASSVLMTGAISWGLTARQLQSNSDSLEMLSAIQEGLDLFCPGQPTCGQFRAKFEEVMLTRARIK